jgi:hypothetical protein
MTNVLAMANASRHPDPGRRSGSAAARGPSRRAGLFPRVVSALLVLMSAAVTADVAPARLQVTQRAAVVECLDGVPVPTGRRSWTVSAPVTLAVTMRNRPRPGVADADPGIAIVRFTPDAGHRYELEVQAEPMRFSTRVWPKGEWAPVVRDRTTDRVVSGLPDWATSVPCAPAR